LILLLRGAIEARPDDGSEQSDTVKVFDDDSLDDDLLRKQIITTQIPDDAWNGVLLPYDINVQLQKKSGYISGDEKSSGEEEAEVYQYLIVPEGNISSDDTTVP